MILGAQKLSIHKIYSVVQKLRTGHFLPLTSSNLNRVSIFFTVGKSEMYSEYVLPHLNLNMLLHYLGKC